MPSKCIVINLFGVPSAGNSTGAAYIKYENLQVFHGIVNRVLNTLK